MTEENLDNNENISIIFFSTLYYQQKWKTKFVDSETYKDIFHIDNNTNKEIYFMKHTYYVDDYYDYDNYISFYDYYSNNYLIQYLIPKLLNYNILELVNNTNFLFENENNKKNETTIILSVPKINITNEIDFIPILKNLGLEKLFNKYYSTLNNPFIKKPDYNYYISKMKQKNQLN